MELLRIYPVYHKGQKMTVRGRYNMEKWQENHSDGSMRKTWPSGGCEDRGKGHQPRKMDSLQKLDKVRKWTLP